jgi:solute carrier family 45 protein 1/2/4
MTSTSFTLRDATQNSGYEDIRSTDDWVPLAKRDKLSIMRIIGICASMLGYQTVYSVLFALAYPMMDKLNIPQFWRSFIMMAGPVCGLTVQPLVGFYSDGAHSNLGRRRPFIIVGTIGVLIGFILLYFCQELGNAISEVRGQAWGIVFFIIAILAAFFFINFMQGPARTIVGDVVPKQQQVLANSIGSIMVGIAQVINNFVGGLNVYKYLGFSENYQLVIIFGCILIIVSVTLTCITAVEEPFHDHLERQNPFVEIVRALKQMPKPVTRICWVLFFSWMGYFMFNVEVTDYCGTDLYRNQGLSYDDGVSFGMIVMGVSNILVMIFGPFQDAFIKKFGLKTSYAFSQILEAICLVPIFFVRNKWAALALLAPLGISCTIFNSVPYAIVGTYAADDEMGTYMGILNIFVVSGQQIVNWLLGSGLGSIVTKWKGPQIASGSIFALLAAIMCSWIIVPTDDQEKLQPLIAEKE